MALIGVSFGLASSCCLWVSVGISFCPDSSFSMDIAGGSFGSKSSFFVEVVVGSFVSGISFSSSDSVSVAKSSSLRKGVNNLA